MYNGPMATAQDKLREGCIKRIHVNQQKIRDEAPDPIIIRTTRGAIHATEIAIHGPSTLVYRPDKPLSNGAKLWIETMALVEVTK